MDKDGPYISTVYYTKQRWTLYFYNVLHKTKMDLIFLQCITQNKDGPYISTVYYTKQRENSSDFRTSIERSVQSEDSGLQSTIDDLPCTSERNVDLTRKIYPKNLKQPISALFGFPSFDELCDRTKKFKTVLKRVPSEVITSQEQKPCEQGSIEVCETVEELPSTIKRMDSLMSQDFYTTLYTSWEGSNRFAEFRRKFGEALRHKYFSYCRFDDTVFIGIFVVYGMFLVCAGTYNYLSCRSDILTNSYFITDGVLSVFVFPVLVMSWKVRVGGCVNESAKVGPGTVWFSVLVARIMSSSLGAVILYYQVNSFPEKLTCQVGYYLSYTAIILEWSFLLLAIFIPLTLYGVAYFCAPAYNTHNRQIGST